MPTNAKPALSRASSRRRLFWFGFRVAVVAYLTILLLLMWFEESLIFPAPKYPLGRWDSKPAAVEEVNLSSADGTKLHGWYLPHPAPRYYVLYFHGNGENVSTQGDLMLLLSKRLHASVLAIDYRGYGRSEGKPKEAGVLADARAARTWLCEKAGIKPTDIVLHGRSIGGAVAVDLAADGGAKALVLENTFSSLPDAAAVHYRWVPVHWIMHTRFNSERKIKDYFGPLLMSHAGRDTIVPIELGRRLFDAASGKKEFFTIEHGDHNDPQPPEFYNALVRFLNDVAPSEATNTTVTR